MMKNSAGDVSSPLRRAVRVALEHRALLLVLLAILAGCGSVDWFPQYERQPTTPDLFSFATRTGVPLFSTVSSAQITVAGLTAATSPISVSGAASSKYSVNDGTFTSSAGTVQNGDRVSVSHTSASSLGTTATTTLTIGNVTGSFTSVTRNVGDLAFTSQGNFGIYRRAVANVTSIDGVTGTHVISIKDSAGTNNALYSVGPSSTEPTTFSNATQTIPILNNQWIFVENLVTATGVTTTLTIDGIDFPVVLSQL